MSVYEQINALPRAGIGKLLTKKIGTTALAFVTVIACATSAFAQAAVAASELSASELAKEINNPVTSLWQLQFQFNNYKLETGDSEPREREVGEQPLFQPVLPVSLTKDINLITRPVITLFQSVPHPTLTGDDERTTAFGDTILATVLSPRTEPLIVAAGPTWDIPYRWLGFYRTRQVAGRARCRRWLHHGQAYDRSLGPAMVVFRRRRGPQRHKPDEYPAFDLSFLRRRMERRLLR